MAFGHNKLCQPPAVNSLSVTLKNVVGFGHNKLWQPPPVNSISVTLRSYPYAAALTMVEALLVTKGHNISSVKDL